MAKSSRSRVNVSAENFVAAVLEVSKAGGTHSDVAAKLGIAVGSVATRCSQLRTKHGVNIPNFKRGGSGGGRKLDVSGLNAMIAASSEG